MANTIREALEAISGKDGATIADQLNQLSTTPGGTIAEALEGVSTGGGGIGALVPFSLYQGKPAIGGGIPARMDNIVAVRFSIGGADVFGALNSFEFAPYVGAAAGVTIGVYVGGAVSSLDGFSGGLAVVTGDRQIESITDLVSDFHFELYEDEGETYPIAVFTIPTVTLGAMQYLTAWVVTPQN